MRASKIVNFVMATSVGLLAVTPVFLSADVAHAASISAPGCTADVGTDSTATLTRVNANCVLKFTSGSNTWTVPNSMTSVRVLVVGGGGGGGQNGGGGGGGGQVVSSSSFSVTGGSSLAVTVGAGGASPGPSDWNSTGGTGGTSVFDSLSAIGGGGGGTRGSNPSANNGRPGWSGGGGGGYNTTGGVGSGGGNGGNGIELGCDSTGGGGGGASGAGGTNGAYRAGGTGGPGISSDISGTMTYYGGGGAGGGTCDNTQGQTWSGTPGLGGGARASSSGVANTGGGAGGGGAVGWSQYGGTGGSGVVILSWPGLPIAPFSTTSPSISGTAQKTATLTGSAGVWSQSPSSYTYKWKRSSTAGGSYVDIAGATGLTYTVTADDVDKYLKFEVTATNGNGSSSEMSSATAQVTDLPNSVAATLGTPSSTASGFTVAITNFSSLGSYTIGVTTSAGSVSRSSGIVTVSGLAAGASATLTVTTSRSGYNDATSTVTGSSTPAPTTTSTTTTTTTTVVSSTTVAPSTTVAAVTTTSEVAPTTTAPIAQTQIARVVTTTTTAERAGQNAVASTTTTTTPRPVATTSAPTTTTTVPEIAEAAPGEAAILVGGEPVESTVTRSNDQLVISAGDMAATISGITADGAVAPLDNDGNIRLSEGDQIQVEASGFAPNSDVEVWLFSTPTLLGTVTVNAQGTATATFPLPRGAESGNHRVALNGKNSAGDDASFAVGIVIGSSSGGVSTAGKVLISIPIAAAVLFALVIPARRRRKATTV